MGFSEINRSSDIYSNHAAPNRIDLLRLIAEGKRPAPQEENKRPIGENGKPLEKLQLDPKREFLLGGMPRGDQASTSGRIRAEDLARMSPSEQVDWCVQGGLAEALGPDGDRTLVPIIKQILLNNRIEDYERHSIINAIGLSSCSANYDHEFMQIVRNKQENSWVRRYALKAIGLSSCSANYDHEFMQIVRDNQEIPWVRKYAAKSINLSSCSANYAHEFMQIARNKQENSWVRAYAAKVVGLSSCSANYAHEFM